MNIHILREQLDRLYQQQNFTLAHQFLLDNIEAARNQQDSTVERGLLNDLLGYYRMIGHEPRGYAVARQIEKMLDPQTQELNQAIAYQNLATFYTAFDDLENALRCYQLVESYYNVSPPEDQEIYVSFLNNYSLFLLKQKHMEKAIDLQEQAISLLALIPNMELEKATSISNLASMYEHNNPQKAHETYTHSFMLFDEIGPTDPHYMSALINAGVFYQRQGILNLAETCFTKALPLSEHYQTAYHQQLIETLEEIKQTITKRNTPAHQLAYDMYQNDFLPELIRTYPEALERISIGLVGKGSECFGLDDAYSWDHDLSTNLCIFLDEEDQALWYDKLKQFYEAFITRTNPQAVTMIDHLHRGVILSEQFYLNHLGSLPKQPQDWFTLNEHALANCTNGFLFENNAPHFKAIRQQLLDYYPKDVWIKKVMGCFARISQSGQYNYPRAMMRRDIEAAQLAINHFVSEAWSLFYLYQHHYQPFYKWTIKQAKTLAPKDSLLSIILNIMNLPVTTVAWESFIFPHALNTNDELTMQIELFAKTVVKHDAISSLLTNENPFLQQHLSTLKNHIEQTEIRERHVLED